MLFKRVKFPWINSCGAIRVRLCDCSILDFAHVEKSNFVGNR